MRTKVTKRGQVAVPSEVRKKLNICANSTVERSIEGNTARIIPIPADPINAFRGSGPKDSWIGAPAINRDASLLHKARKFHKFKELTQELLAG